jgi:hypothetical protein
VGEGHYSSLRGVGSVRERIAQCDFAEDRGLLEEVKKPSHGSLVRWNIEEVERREVRQTFPRQIHKDSRQV